MSRRTMPSSRASKPRDERLAAQISREQKTLVQRAAELQGRAMTDFVITSVHDAAVRTIEGMQVMRLSADESRAFAEAVPSPREPNDQPKAAVPPL